MLTERMMYRGKLLLPASFVSVRKMMWILGGMRERLLCECWNRMWMTEVKDV